jgi:hypothetical protein
MATQSAMSGLSREAGPPDSRPSLNNAAPGLTPHRKVMLLGLPCARCKTYFAAGLGACPICGCNERIVIGDWAVSAALM